MFSACNSSNNYADAYGNFTAEEIILASETGGKVVKTYAREGTVVEQSEMAVQIDSLQYYLKVKELESGKKATKAKLINIQAQVEVFEKQKSILERDMNRIKKMLKDGAATQKQYDDITGQIEVITKQKKSVLTNRLAVRAEINSIQAGINQAQDMLNRTKIKFPVSGVILEQYAQQGEIVRPGKAIYKLANLNEMKLKAYVSGKQLSGLKIGQKVTVLIDAPDGGNKEYGGQITWIASKSEFTPKNIQTKEERLSQVYAVEILVNNDGYIKINMPGEVIFSSKND
jgi:HlyD family secretion protein